MISPQHRELVRAAQNHARTFHDGDSHTVAAALLTRSGRTVLGLNVHHFLGGPCGEVSALAQHASTAPDDPVTAIVAVYGPTEEVVSPCGKYRQVLYDLDPAIECVVRGPNGFEAHTVEALLPLAFSPASLTAIPTMYMWEGYEESIREGSKTQTIRVDDPFRVGPVRLVFERESGETVTMDSRITRVSTIRRRELTQDHALRDGFGELDELHAALDAHYPGLGAENPVDIVEFKVNSPDGDHSAADQGR